MKSHKMIIDISILDTLGLKVHKVILRPEQVLTMNKILPFYGFIYGFFLVTYIIILNYF